MKTRDIKNNFNKGIQNTMEVDWRNKCKSVGKHERPAVFMEYSNQINHYFKQGNSNETN